MKEIIGVIPARYGSKRLPGKPLKLINGISMIERVYTQAKKSSLNKIIIATDSIKIYNHAITFISGQDEVMMTSNKHICGTDRVIEASEQIISSGFTGGFINIQGDEPFIEPEDIDLVKKSIIEYPQFIITLVTDLDINDLNNKNITKVSLDEDNMVITFSRNNIKGRNIFKHKGLYGFSNNMINKINKLSLADNEKYERLEQLRWIDNKIPIFTKYSKNSSFSVDTNEDLNRAEEYCK